MINIKDNAKIMADLLHSGYTMLNLSCPVCNNPLFRYKGRKIFCPICNKTVIIEKDKNSQENSNMIKEEIKNKEILIKKNIKFKIKLNSLKKILEEKIELISQKLKDETQIDLIERYTNLLINLYNFLNKLMNNNASAGI